MDFLYEKCISQLAILVSSAGRCFCRDDLFVWIVESCVCNLSGGGMYAVRFTQ